MQSELVKNGLVKQSPKKRRHKKRHRRKKKPEELSTREVEEMMGMRRPTYRRGTGGAIRQR